MEQPKLINNISERVVDDFKQRLSKGACVSIAAASFSIYAYEALKEELEQVEPVSYTHLDVYKRQSVFCGSRSGTVQRSGEIPSYQCRYLRGTRVAEGYHHRPSGSGIKESFHRSPEVFGEILR